MAPGARMYIIEERCTLHFLTDIIDFETHQDIVHRLGNIVGSIVSSHLLKVYYMSQKTSTKEFNIGTLRLNIFYLMVKHTTSDLEVYRPCSKLSGAIHLTGSFCLFRQL